MFFWLFPVVVPPVELRGVEVANVAIATSQQDQSTPATSASRRLREDCLLLDNF